MGPEDAEIVERWRRGDPAGFEDLVRRWQGPLARFLGRLLGHQDVAQDLCQEVFLRVYRARDRYHENGSFPVWLYRVALNVARDAGRRRPAPAALGGHEPADLRDPAEVVCQRREWADVLAAAVAELPEPLRLVLLLRHYEGLNFEQIARLTGTPASTLKSRFASALARLRQRLQDQGWDEP